MHECEDVFAGFFFRYLYYRRLSRQAMERDTFFSSKSIILALSRNPIKRAACALRVSIARTAIGSPLMIQLLRHVSVLYGLALRLRTTLIAIDLMFLCLIFIFLFFLQIWWTALSVALGLNVRGDVIKGVPCVKKNHQLFCPTAGNSYPM